MVEIKDGRARSCVSVNYLFLPAAKPTDIMLITIRIGYNNSTRLYIVFPVADAFSKACPVPVAVDVITVGPNDVAMTMKMTMPITAIAKPETHDMIEVCFCTLKRRCHTLCLLVVYIYMNKCSVLSDNY